MKIAFTSCFDALEDPKQPVWGRVLKQQPEILLLLGDSIYMDYFPKLGRPRKWSAQEFADEMYRRYAAQWRVDSFRELVDAVNLIGVTWDDHDFAWNGSCGAGHGKKTAVPRDKRLIARGLNLQFREQLRRRPVSAQYPPQPDLATLLAGPDAGIEETFDQGRVRCILLDGRSFREDQQDERETTLLGIAQRNWLAEQVRQWNGVNLVCTGSTLSRSKESWDNYSDYEWLMDQCFENVIVLSGDVHENVYRQHKFQSHNGERYLVELTSSGAARPGIGGDEGNFGLLDIQANEISVALFDEDGPQIKKTINL